MTTAAVREQAIQQMAAIMKAKSPGTDPDDIAAAAETLVDAAIQIRDGDDDSQPD